MVSNMNYDKLKQEIDNGESIILEKEDAFKLIKTIDPGITIPWIYSFARGLKFYKIEGEYIIEPNKLKGGV